ncbi:MAG TPA: DUF4157 domain-containing protein, partial [Stellaceae bacterium]
MLSGSPRYLRANIRLGGLHDHEEHEADHAASVLAAGGRHRVHDPGGVHHLRATGTATTTRPSPAAADGVRPMAAHAAGDAGGSGGLRPMPAEAVVDPGAEGRVRRAPGHESETGPVRAMPATIQREAEKHVRASPVTHPDASGHRHAKPAHEAADPGGAHSLRAMPARVIDPGASGRIRRLAEPQPTRAEPAETARAKSQPLSHAPAAHDAHPADDEAAQRIETARTGIGHPLPPAVRARLEHGFGETMAGVRVDTSRAGRAAAAAIGARAYTEGERITLGHGESEHDLKLMAHEATHVVQNRRLGHPGRAGFVERTEIRRREIRPAEDADSDDDRTYRMRDGRVIDLPDDMTRADAAKLEADGEAAKRHLGQGPPPQPVPDVRKPADRSKA